jgi:hypothetical protein
MAKQQKPARAHHVVSKFYLRGFANAKEQLIRRLLDGDPHPVFDPQSHRAERFLHRARGGR